MAKNTQKKVLQLLICLTLASASLTGHQCSDNCSICEGQNLCAYCYERKVIPLQGILLGKCSSQPQSATDRCQIYGAKGCAGCKPGFALVNKASGNSLCVKGTIQNCLDERVVAGTLRLCNSCQGGYPTPGKTRCIPKDQIKNPIQFCSVGQRDPGDGSLQCAKCMPGYTSNVYSCYKSTGDSVGCLQTFVYQKYNCAICDLKNGYFMRNQNACSKNGNASQI